MVAFCRARLRAKSLFCSISVNEWHGYVNIRAAAASFVSASTTQQAQHACRSNTQMSHFLTDFRVRETARSVQGILTHINVISQQKTVTEWPENQLITCRFSSTLISCKVHVVAFLKCFSFLFLWFELVIWVLNFAGIFIRRSLILRFSRLWISGKIKDSWN